MENIQCYLLRVEPKETHTAIIMSKHGIKDICSGKSWHRAEIPIDESTTFEDIREKLLPVRCMYCGLHEFNSENSSITLSHSDCIYINPVTHVVSSNVRVAAAPGAMWFCPWLVEDGHVYGMLSDQYKKDWLGKRPPIALMLPGGSEWVVDQCARNAGSSGWKVTGTAPVLTASPSIDAPGYHGWLENGFLRKA